MDGLESYLQPTRLCDFDKGKAIAEVAFRLAEGCSHDLQRLDRIYQFVREQWVGGATW